MKSPSKLITIVGLVFTMLVPALPLSDWANEFGGVRHLVGYECIWWGMVAAVLLYVHFVEGRPLSSIGFRKPRPKQLLLGAVAGLLAIAGLAFLYYVVLPALHLDETSQMNAILNTPLWWRIISVIRAAVSEEVLYRGYAIERLEELTGSRALAATVSWAVFAFAHVGYWGWAHLIIAGFGGGVLTLLYLWRRNIWVSMVAHFVIDSVSIVA